MGLKVSQFEKIWIDGLNNGDVSVADESFAPNCIIHMAGAPKPNLTVDEFKELLKGLLVAFPDLRLTVEDQLISGDKVATRWSAVGTQKGPLGDLQATGKRAEFEGLIIDYVVDGKVIERWEQWDQVGMLKQLGVL